MIGYSTLAPCVSLMSPIHRRWESASSTLSAATLQLRAANSPDRLLKRPSSVVHTGVKSAGCEQRHSHEPSLYSYRSNGPKLDSPCTLGIASPIRRYAHSAIVSLQSAQSKSPM